MARWTPSILPSREDDDQNVYLVVDDFGRNGRAFREADEEADLETVISDMLSGEYKNPARCDMQMRDVPFGLQEFVDRHKGRYHDVQLPLPMRLA